MATTLLSIGYPQTLTQDQEYALPANACYIYAVGTAPVIANALGGSYAALPSSGVVAAGFIKSTGSGTIVTLKKF